MYFNVSFHIMVHIILIANVSSWRQTTNPRIILSMLLEGSFLGNSNIPQFNIQNLHEFKDAFKIKKRKKNGKKKKKKEVKKKYATSSRNHMQNLTKKTINIAWKWFSFTSTTVKHLLWVRSRFSCFFFFFFS